MTTRVRKLNSDRDYWNAIGEAASCLACGGLVGFPTETVYGLAANAADAGAMARLRQVKQRDESKPFTVHVGSRSSVDRFVPGLAGLGRRLINKAWPGPLTLVFQVDNAAATPVIQETSTDHVKSMYHEGTIGIRCPDDRAATDLLIEARVPVVAASANPAGHTAPRDADEVLATLDGQIDFLLDNGPTRYAKASTIVKVNGSSYEIIREGVIDERTIRRLTKVCFLLVCSGNTCRSPMAEGLLRRLLAERLQCDESELEDRRYSVESAGTSAFEGGAVSSSAVRALDAQGIDISGHRSRPLTLEMVNRADYIFTMTRQHENSVRALAPTVGTQVRTIDETDIEDPIGGDESTYAESAERIEKALRQRLEEITL